MNLDYAHIQKINNANNIKPSKNKYQNLKIILIMFQKIFALMILKKL